MRNNISHCEKTTNITSLSITRMLTRKPMVVILMHHEWKLLLDVMAIKTMMKTMMSRMNNYDDDDGDHDASDDGDVDHDNHHHVQSTIHISYPILASSKVFWTKSYSVCRWKVEMVKCTDGDDASRKPHVWWDIWVRIYTANIISTLSASINVWLVCEQISK